MLLFSWLSAFLRRRRPIVLVLIDILLVLMLGKSIVIELKPIPPPLSDIFLGISFIIHLYFL